MRRVLILEPLLLQKSGEPRFRGRFVGKGLAIYRKLQALRVQGVKGKDQLRTLGIGQPVRDEIDVKVLVRSVNLVAHYGVSNVREVNSNLMFSSGMRLNFEQTIRVFVAVEFPQELP